MQTKSPPAFKKTTCRANQKPSSQLTTCAKACFKPSLTRIPSLLVYYPIEAQRGQISKEKWSEEQVFIEPLSTKVA